jgi:hypothetical protein
MWITAQGRFVDPRVRPIDLRPGVGHIASKLKAGLVVPAAVEYPFWSERTPVALARVGQPLIIDSNSPRTAKEWTSVIENALTLAQDQLAVEAISRDPALFTPLVMGKAGTHGVYDIWRRMKAWLRGQRFDAAHDAPPPTDNRS